MNTRAFTFFPYRAMASSTSAVLGELQRGHYPLAATPSVDKDKPDVGWQVAVGAGIVGMDGKLNDEEDNNQFHQPPQPAAQ